MNELKGPLPVWLEGFFQSGDTRSAVAGFDFNAGALSNQSNGQWLGLLVALGLYKPTFGVPVEPPRTPSVYKSGATALVAATDTAIWTPQAGRKFRLLWLVASHSVASDLILKDNNAGAQIAEAALTAAGVPAILVPPWHNGYFSVAANNTLSARAAVGGTLTWTAWGCEE